MRMHKLGQLSWMDREMERQTAVETTTDRQRESETGTAAVGHSDGL